MMGCCPKGPPRVPTFNLPVGIYFSFAPRWPVLIGVPNFVVNGALVLGDRVTVQLAPTPIYGAYVFLPKLTDVSADRLALGDWDGVEFPLGSGRFYKVLFVDDVGKGYPNEYRQVLVQHLYPWPVPTP